MGGGRPEPDHLLLAGPDAPSGSLPESPLESSCVLMIRSPRKELYSALEGYRRCESRSF